MGPAIPLERHGGCPEPKFGQRFRLLGCPARKRRQEEFQRDELPGFGERHFFVGDQVTLQAVREFSLARGKDALDSSLIEFGFRDSPTSLIMLELLMAICGMGC